MVCMVTETLSPVRVECALACTVVCLNSKMVFGVGGFLDHF